VLPIEGRDREPAFEPAPRNARKTGNQFGFGTKRTSTNRPATADHYISGQSLLGAAMAI
jgi:hypothetical protein